MFCNRLIAKENYAIWFFENLLYPIQTQLSLKPLTFSRFFVPFLEAASKFKHFEEKDDCYSYFVLEITDCQRLG